MKKYYCELIALISLLINVQVAYASDLELWLGQVEFAQLRDGTNKAGEHELIIEWLCRRYEPTAELELDKLDTSEMFVGGAGIVAKHLKNLGADVTFTTILGDDEIKDFVIRDLKKWKIKTNAIMLTAIATVTNIHLKTSLQRIPYSYRTDSQRFWMAACCSEVMAFRLLLIMPASSGQSFRIPIA